MSSRLLVFSQKAVKTMAFRYGQNYIKYKKTIRSLFELIQVLTQIVNHPYLVSYRVITK